MRIAFLYSEMSLGGRPFDFANLWTDKRGTTGSEISLLCFAAEMANRGNEVVLYVPQASVESGPDGFCTPNTKRGVLVRHMKEFAAHAATFDVAYSWNEPDALRDVPSSVLRCVNQQLNDWTYCRPDFDRHIDLYTSPSDHHRERVARAGGIDPAKWETLPNGVYPDAYDLDAKVPGRVIYTSSPDRGLHLTLAAWPAIRKRVPDATLRIFYFSLQRWLDAATDSRNVPVDAGGKEHARRAHYVKAALERYKHLGIEVVGSTSRVDMARQYSEAMVLGFPCDTIAYTEGFCVAALEGCASGAIPVISDVDALGSIYGGSAPMVAAPAWKHMAEWTDLVVRGLTDEAWRAEQVARGRALGAKHAWPILAERLEHILIARQEAKKSHDRVKTPQAERVEDSIRESVAVLKDAPEGIYYSESIAPQPSLCDVLCSGCRKPIAGSADDPFFAPKPGVASAFFHPGCATPFDRVETSATVRVVSEVVSDPGARVTETVTHLAPEVAKKLETKGEIPRGARAPRHRPTIHLTLTPPAASGQAMDPRRMDADKYGGGARAGFLGLCAALPALGYDVRAFAPFATETHHDGVWYIPIGRLKNFAAPDVVLAYFDTSTLAGVPTSTLRIASHHSFQPFPTPHFMCTDVNTAPSQHAMSEFQRFWDPWGTWRVLPNASADLGVKHKPFPGRVIHHGSPSRGLELLVGVWPEIKRRVPVASLHVIGDLHGWMDGPNASTALASNVHGRRVRALREGLVRAQKAGGVRTFGSLPRAQLNEELAAASCFAFPCSTIAPCETFSVSVLECCRLGVPVVLSPADSLASIYEGAVRMVPAPAHEHMAEFTDAVVEILQDETSARYWSARGKKLAARYTFDAAAEALDAIIREQRPGLFDAAPVRATNGVAVEARP